MISFVLILNVTEDLSCAKLLYSISRSTHILIIILTCFKLYGRPVLLSYRVFLFIFPCPIRRTRPISYLYFALIEIEWNACPLSYHVFFLFPIHFIVVYNH